MEIENFYGAKNQFLIEGENFSLLQSYNSIVAVKYSGVLYLGCAHDYSHTTCKYVKLFCGKTASERRAGLASGEIKKINKTLMKN